MATKKFLQPHQLKKELKKKRIKIDIDEKALFRNTNYFQVINGIESLFLPSPTKNANGTFSARPPKDFNNRNLSDFVEVYKFDEALSAEILLIISRFESKLKTSISNHFGRRNCITIPQTMEYTNKLNYLDPNTVPNYPMMKDRRDPTLHSDFDPVKYQYEDIVVDFHKFKLFRPKFLENLIAQNDFIKGEFYTNPSYITNPNVSRYTHNGKEVAVPLWVAIQTFDFGTIIRFCHYMTTADFRPILSDFGLTPMDRFYFLNCLDVIRNLRNSCAHFSLIYRFESASNVGLSNDLVTRLNLSPSKTRSPQTRIKLFDALKILNQFENTRGLLDPIKKIIYKINVTNKSDQYEFQIKLLSKMGNSDYTEWKKMLKQNPLS